MTMTDPSQVQSALQEMYPECMIRVLPADMSHRLGIAVDNGITRFAVYTPLNLDYRHMDYREIVARAVAEIDPRMAKK